MTPDRALPMALLAAWLFCLGVPMGAMPLVLGAEALGLPERGLLPALRRMLRLAPAAALLGAPVLWLAAGRMGGGAAERGWWAPLPFALREAGVLTGVSLLALGFARAPRHARPASAIGAGFGFLVLATLGATDWWLGPQPALGSSLIGMLLVASQAGSAICAACLMRPRGEDGRAGLLLALAFAAWAGLHFVQFLVVWSANLPGEAEWYLARCTGIGGWMMAYGGLVAALAITAAPGSSGTRLLVALAAAGLSAHLLECWWFVAPGGSGALRFGGWNAATMAAACGLVLFGLRCGRRAA